MPAVKTKKSAKSGSKKTATKAKKATSSKKITKKKIVRRKKEVAPKFVTINEYDAEFESKNKLTWLIVGIIGIFIFAFWFWTLGERTKTQSKGVGLAEISNEISIRVNEINENFDEAKTILIEKSEETAREIELAQIKDEIIQKIQANLNSANWPMHTSGIMGLSLQYPENWTKLEQGGTLTLSTELKEGVVSEIVIVKHKNSSDISLGSDRELGEEDVTIGDIAVPVYQKSNGDTIDWLIIVSHNNDIYKITAVTDNVYEPVVKQIFSTIEFE
jgi:hypothetical protein